MMNATFKYRVDVTVLNRLKNDMPQISNSISFFTSKEVAERGRNSVFRGEPVPRRTGITRQALREMPVRNARQGMFFVGLRRQPVAAAGRSTSYFGRLYKKYNVQRSLSALPALSILKKKTEGVLNYYLKKAKT